MRIAGKIGLMKLPFLLLTLRNSRYYSLFQLRSVMLAITIKDTIEEEDETKKAFVDQEEGYLDLNQLLAHLKASEVVVLLLTKEVLRRPYCLLELNHAVVCKIPIVPVLVEGDGYDYAEATDFLVHLDTKLDSAALALVKEERVDILDVAYHLSNVIPKVIAKPFNFKSAKAIRTAQLGAIVKGVHEARFSEIKKSKKEWFVERG
jgi:hypothetical protein